VEVRHLLGPEHAATAGEILQPVWQAIQYIRDAFVAVALVTLGAQVALLKDTMNKYPVALSVCIRLLVGPAVGLGLIWLFGLHGLLAQVLLISTATPSAVNTMLLCLQFDNHPDFAARAVVYSTLLSPITVTLVIFLAKSGMI
jgi:predicted permease